VLAEISVHDDRDSDRFGRLSQRRGAHQSAVYSGILILSKTVKRYRLEIVHTGSSLDSKYCLLWIELQLNASHNGTTPEDWVNAVIQRMYCHSQLLCDLPHVEPTLLCKRPRFYSRIKARPRPLSSSCALLVSSAFPSYPGIHTASHPLIMH